MLTTERGEFLWSRGPADPGRRSVLDLLGKCGVCAAVGVVLPGSLFAWQSPAIQDNWRNCNKCSALFFNGYRRGRCPAGGAHAGDNRNYKVSYNSPGPGQRDWRFCNKCEAMFYDGYPTKGVCPAGGAHVAQGFNFSLRFDNRAPGEPEWRFCNKCQVIFHNRGGSQGRCAAGGGHVAAGYRFVLDDSVRID
jgi:hypothetical protein